jgi:hypothetical protein
MLHARTDERLNLGSDYTNLKSISTIKTVQGSTAGNLSTFELRLRPFEVCWAFPLTAPH